MFADLYSVNRSYWPSFVSLEHFRALFSSFFWISYILMTKSRKINIVTTKQERREKMLICNILNCLIPFSQCIHNTLKF